MMTTALALQAGILPEHMQETVNLPLVMSGLSPHTRRCYSRWIKQYLETVAGYTARDLTQTNIAVCATALNIMNLRAWLGQLRSQNLGKQSLGQAKAAAVWLAQVLGDMDRISLDVAAGLSRVKLPRAETGQRHGTWLSVEQCRDLLLAAGAGPIAPANARNQAIVALLVVCGLRRAEITTLRWRDLQRQGSSPTLIVHGKGSKRREIKLADVAAKALAAWQLYHPDAENPEALLFTRIMKNGRITLQSITDKSVWLIVRDCAVSAGLGQIAPHDLRRSFARGAYEAGASMELVRQSLGHSNIATTERYVNSVLELNNAATDIWSEVLSGAAK